MMYNTNDFDRSLYEVALQASEAIPSASIAVLGLDEKLHLLNSSSFRISCPLLYVGNAYSADNVTNSFSRVTNYTYWGTPFNLTNTHSIQNATANTNVYVVGTLSGDIFTPNTTVLTCAEPTTEDGLYYMLLGRMTSTRYAILQAEHPIYIYKNGKFQKLEATTATSYITYIDANNGIKIHNESDTLNYLQLNSTAISIYRNNIETFNVNNNEVRIGKINDNNVFIDNDSVDIRDGQNTLASFTGDNTKFYDPIYKKELAIFGASGAIIGANSEQRFIIEKDGIKSINDSGATVFSVNSTNGTVVTEAQVASGGESHYLSGKTVVFDTVGTGFTTNTTFYTKKLTAIIEIRNSAKPLTNVKVNSVTATSTLVDSYSGYWYSSTHSINLSPFTFTHGTSKRETYQITASFVNDYGDSYNLTAQASINYDGNVTLTVQLLTGECVRTSGNNEDIAIMDLIGSKVVYGEIYQSSAYTKAPAMTFGTRGKDAIMAPFSVTMGESLYANNDNQLSIGRYNINNDEYSQLAFAIGNGANDTDRSNAFNVDWDGNVEIAGDLEVTGKLTAKNFGGNYLPSGRNINNLSKYDTGWWAYARSDVDGTFPVSDTYGIIGHIQGTSEGVAMQIIRSNSQVATSPIMYMRYKMSGTWGAWQRYVSATTSNLTITRTNNSYCNATDIGYLQARRKNGYLSLRGNLHLTTSLPNNTADVQIATISNWNGVSGILCVPAQTGNSTILVTITATGVIAIANYSGTATGANWFRFVFTTPCNDGYE